MGFRRSDVVRSNLLLRLCVMSQRLVTATWINVRFGPFADSSRTSPEVREVPTTDIPCCVPLATGESGGCPLRGHHMLPQSYPNYKSVHRRFQTWCRDEVLRRALMDVANELRDKGPLDEA